MNKFAPIEVANLDEGEFAQSLQAEVDRLSAFLAAYRREHGDKALKAKGKIVAEIQFSIESVDDAGAYGVKTQVKSTYPSRPSTVSLAIEGETEDGTRTLFTRATGSDRDDPRQSKLATRDGRTIVDGEVVEETDA